MGNIVLDKLYENQDISYGTFQSSLTPGIPRDKFIGVRIPVLRHLAKELNSKKEEFMKELPHTYFEENMLHGLFISDIKDYNTCIKELEKFLPYVDNWAVCDTMSPVSFKRNKEKLILKIQEWMKSSHLYTVRFGIGMLMKHFLDEDFKPEYLKMVSEIKTEEYYLNMMCAWYFATALAKEWEYTIPYLKERSLTDPVFKMTVKKAIESYRITDEQKDYLRSLKRVIIK